MGRAKPLSAKQTTSSSPSTKPSPVVGIASENYAGLARAFIGASGGEGFMIARVYHQAKTGERLHATPHAWGAWRWYLLRLGLPRSVRSMEARGYYMVPTESPHEFDAEVSELDCMDAGNEYVAHVNRRKDKAEVHVDRDRVLKEMRARMAA